MTHNMKMRFFHAVVPLLFMLGACSDHPESARSTVAQLLYGQTDPDPASSKGLHGWGHVLAPVTVSALGPCRFRIAASNRSEDLDFKEVEGVRVSIVTDPASGLIAAIGGRTEAKRDMAKLILVQIIGTERAICSAGECVDRRSFAIRDLSRVDAVRRAAADLSSRFCPGRSGEEPR